MSVFRKILDLLFGTTTPRETRSSSQALAPKVAPSSPQPARRQPEVKKLNLDASNFTPLSGSEIKRELGKKGASAWEIFRGPGMSWWGMRNIVPPSSDPRTQFIDRGMVGAGLITPEELVEIHTAGDEMLRIRPELDQAATIAEEAVQQSKQEKEALRARKKAAAEARRKKHAEDVARRKETDIIFLGRGVSRGLSDRRANVEKLAAAGLPILATPGDVAKEMGLSIRALRWLSFHTEAATRPHYIRFTIAKKSGGTRELAAPHEKIRAAQNWILATILGKIPAHAAAHGFVKSRSTRTNAIPHLQPAVLINCDLKDFFPTITVHRVIGMFTEIGFSPAAATILALICTESPRRVVDYAGTTLHVATGPRCLPQGACTSPAISNLIARRLDSRLSGISRKLDFVYTRYADDLTFSLAKSDLPKDDPSHPAKKIGYLLARIRHIAKDEGFAVNETKTHVQRPSSSQRVTGVVVNTDRPTVPRKIRRRLRAIVHQAQKTGLAAQNRHGQPAFESHVRGMIAYIHMINPAQARKLREGLERIS
jgi:RNA-directed DNA polymerase